MKFRLDPLGLGAQTAADVVAQRAARSHTNKPQLSLDVDVEGGGDNHKC